MAIFVPNYIYLVSLFLFRNKVKYIVNPRDAENITVMDKNIKRLGLIAGGTGITPIFQLIRKISSTKKDDTAISLIYASKSVEELAFCHDLIEYDKKGKIYFKKVRIS